MCNIDRILIDGTLTALWQAQKFYESYLKMHGVDPTYDDVQYKLHLASIAVHETWEHLIESEKKQQNVA